MSQVAELIASTAVGGSGTLIIEGAAGIGKTRILTEACAGATEAGLFVAAGAADELDQVTPWRALLQAFASTEPPLLPESALAELAGLADQRLSAVDQMRAALESASSRQPMLVALDDLQWADPSSLLALSMLSSGAVLLPDRLADRSQALASPRSA